MPAELTARQTKGSGEMIHDYRVVLQDAEHLSGTRSLHAERWWRQKIFPRCKMQTIVSSSAADVDAALIPQLPKPTKHQRTCTYDTSLNLDGRYAHSPATLDERSLPVCHEMCMGAYVL